MSAADEQPIDPAEYRPKPLMSFGFWVAMGFAALAILAGVLVVKLGPTLFPAKPTAQQATAAKAAPAPGEQQALASIDARLADMQTRLAAPAPAAGAAPSAELASLSQRVERLEADRRRMAQAAAAALAASSLGDASGASRPFAGELAIAEAALPGSADLRALRPLAQTGAPTLTALTAEYPEFAARAAVAQRAHASGNGFFAVVAKAVAAILTIRRTDQVTGKGVDAVLARAERNVNDGDLGGALAELNALKPAGQDAIAPWRERARRRLEIDRRVAAIRAAALAELTRAANGAPGPTQ